MTSRQPADGYDTDDQAEVLAFLADPRNHGANVDHIERIVTHGAYVFLAGERAIKIKRAVAFSYMDFSTVARRESAIKRELAVNRPAAPEIYEDVATIVRNADGTLAWGEAGPTRNDRRDRVVEWALRMRRFAQNDLLSVRVAAGAIDPLLLERLADAVAASHARAPVVPSSNQTIRLVRIGTDICRVLESAGGTDLNLLEQIYRLRHLLSASLHDQAELIEARAQAGCVRRCHGDLHLDNVVVIEGRPVLFDAIEFSEDIATVDVLYDLAFLLMDLCHRGETAAANVLLNRYLWRDGSDATLDGLGLLGVFMALRAGIRAMVTTQRNAQSHDQHDACSAHAYLRGALALMSPAEPRLIAIGGLSGTGKSTLAAGLAPLVGLMPGAVHLRSDLERKALAGVEPDVRLAPEAYSKAAGAAVYQRLAERAERALRAGACVVVDAVFADVAERQAMADVAARTGVGFDGMWLTAAREALIERVAARRGDASDATPAVVRRQLDYDLGPMTWADLDSGRAPHIVLTEAKALLGIQR